MPGQKRADPRPAGRGIGLLSEQAHTFGVLLSEGEWFPKLGRFVDHEQAHTWLLSFAVRDFLGPE